MLRISIRTLLGVAVAAVLAGGVAVAASSLWIVTAQGAGAVTLGRSYAALRSHGLVAAKLTAGCELGPKRLAAQLRPPASGNVTFNLNRHVVAISVRSAAVSPKGVGVGSTIKQVRAAYPKAKFDKAKPTDPIPFSVIQVIRKGQAAFAFVADASTKKVVEMDVPSPQFCE